MNVKVYPKVYKTNETQVVNVRFSSAVEGDVFVKVQPMEKYLLPHTPVVYRIDEEERYPFEKAEKTADGYALSYAFQGEQKYSVTVKIGDEKFVTHVYAVEKDYQKLRPMKGDTHLHSNRSDGALSPFDVACAYRKSAYDFIAVTDHHRYFPSLEAKKEVEELTSAFTVFPGEEVHNRDMGYFHIVNFGGNASVNDWIEADQNRTHAEVLKIVNEREYPEGVDAYALAYRIMVERKIHEYGGLAIMAHPYWDVYGEYHMPTEETEFIWREGKYDAVELLAGNDENGNGDNLFLSLWEELRTEGKKIPVVGASDFHSFEHYNRFNRSFTVVLAESADEIKEAIKDERSVAVQRSTQTLFGVFGRFRAVKYVRFLMDEYYPEYELLTARHGEAMQKKDTVALLKIEKEIKRFQAEFFAV